MPTQPYIDIVHAHNTQNSVNVEHIKYIGYAVWHPLHINNSVVFHCVIRPSVTSRWRLFICQVDGADRLTIRTVSNSIVIKIRGNFAESLKFPVIIKAYGNLEYRRYQSHGIGYNDKGSGSILLRWTFTCSNAWMENFQSVRFVMSAQHTTMWENNNLLWHRLLWNRL